MGAPPSELGRHVGYGSGGAARRRRASRQGGRAAVSGSASGWRPQSLAAGGKRSGAGCETLGVLRRLLY